MGFSHVAAIALLLAFSSHAGAKPAPSPQPPKKVLIEDQGNDANGINDHHHGPTSETRVGVPIENIRDDADILGVWFTSDRTFLTAHLRTTAPIEKGSGLYYQIDADADLGPVAHGCFLLEYFVEGEGISAQPGVVARDGCGGPTDVGAEAEVGRFADGTGHLAIRVRRNDFLYLQPGDELRKPHASVRAITFDHPVFGVRNGDFFLDITVDGANYKLP